MIAVGVTALSPWPRRHCSRLYAVSRAIPRADSCGNLFCSRLGETSIDEACRLGEASMTLALILSTNPNTLITPTPSP